MKGFKNISVAVVVLSVFLAASAVASQTVTYNGVSVNREIYYGFPGHTSGVYAGEMLYTDNGFTNGPGQGKQFISFCVEATEEISNGEYDAVANNAAWNGGNGGAPDPLDPRTAWLYSNYLDTVVGKNQSHELAKDYQMAIWYLEQEITVKSELSTRAQGLVDTAGTETAIDPATGKAKWTNSDIYIVNVWLKDKAPTYNPDGTLTFDHGTNVFVQDALVRGTNFGPQVPAPAAILLGGLGMTLVGWLRNRKSM